MVKALMGEMERVVRMAEIGTAGEGERLVVYGLGSCVALALWDSAARRGALAHIMLPAAFPEGAKSAPGKFADTAVEALLEALGTDARCLEAKMAGGANLFMSLGGTGLHLGLRNVMAVREALERKGVPLKGEEVGGVKGRTVVFHGGDGRLEVRRFHQPPVWL